MILGMQILAVLGVGLVVYAVFGALFSNSNPLAPTLSPFGQGEGVDSALVRVFRYVATHVGCYNSNGQLLGGQSGFDSLNHLG